MTISTFRKFGMVLAVLMSTTAANAQSGPPGAMGAMPPVDLQVGVVEMARQAVPRVVTSPGRAVAFQEVGLRPRVGGVIEDILYTPGQMLEVGDPLFRIDDAAYLAAAATARANVATAEAKLTLMQAAYDRAQQLEGRGSSTAEVEAALANLEEAEATLDAARAALDYAQTELSWTTLTSPIKGRAGVSTVSVGDLVTAGQADALTTIIRFDPIYVDMMEASARILSIRSSLTDGTLEQNDTLQATLTLENGEVYRGNGQLVTPGNTVSTSTGTVTIRFQFDNPQHVILPGMFVRGDVAVGTVQAYLVPQRAATRGASGELTAYILAEDGTAQQVTLQDDGSYENAWIVRDGLKDGDKLIVDGLSALRPGQAVTQVAAVIDQDGIARDADAPATGE